MSTAPRMIIVCRHDQGNFYCSRVVEAESPSSQEKGSCREWSVLTRLFFNVQATGSLSQAAVKYAGRLLLDDTDGNVIECICIHFIYDVVSQ